MNGAGYDDFAAVYDRYLGPAARAIWQLGIVTELSRMAGGPMRVLDLGAGTGVGGALLTEAVPDAEVTALDASAEMLDRNPAPPERRIVADLAEFTVPPASFDVVVSGFSTLNHLPPDRLADCLSCVARALRPGGLLLFDYCSHRYLTVDAAGPPIDLPSEEAGPGERLCRERHSWEAAAGRSRTFLTFYRDDVPVWSEAHLQYTLDPFAVEELGRGCGLSTLGVRDLHGTGFTPGHPGHLYVLQRDA